MKDKMLFVFLSSILLITSLVGCVSNGMTGPDIVLLTSQENEGYYDNNSVYGNTNDSGLDFGPHVSRPETRPEGADSKNYSSETASMADTSTKENTGSKADKVSNIHSSVENIASTANTVSKEDATSGTNNSKISNTTSQITETRDSSKPSGDNKKWVLNTNTKKIHVPSCSYVKRISEKNYAESSKRIADLVQEGYEACKFCKPKD
ncbi:MAG TPA: hypothetical protein GXX17_08120 [Clostridiales bacterium]|nr:hypothetical protein [Clostridiales bacterium]